MKLILAPMEGLVDAQMRQILTTIGGIDQGVTEFIRVNDLVLPSKSFYKIAPELKNAGKTLAGTPISIQLLGSNPDVMGENAKLAVKLGAPAIDLNFGCPSKRVNSHKGGSVLLKEPNIVHDVVKAVRTAVPKEVPVTAKMRLGYEDKSQALENAHAIEEGGASEVCVHARTKVEGYRPPVHWEWIARIREAVEINVVANGDVCTVDDYKRCREVSSCDDVMIGRGLIAKPDLARLIQHDNQSNEHNTLQNAPVLSWQEFLPVLRDFYREIWLEVPDKHGPGRLKQWLNFLKLQYPEAQELFTQVRGIKDPEIIDRMLLPDAFQEAS
ncbi:tRNA-dihydrouridine synthase C [Kiloniella spongiae]|uniref:tRNA-dihydrouridine(16) synthase n=1 Tax=Kiloniella spongiae TaxID=1489064 RepID=A0A0H2MFF8_9PROT|nr:tRNA-dihydrouridine synthase family protein [Kiloniella spongiae]KLN60926.1 tRNA-dihydrouridine synthase C [Kiloniella spongiae]